MATTNSAKKPKGMNKKSLTHFEKRLLDERKRVLKELGRADEAFGATPQSADGDLSSYLAGVFFIEPARLRKNHPIQNNSYCEDPSASFHFFIERFKFQLLSIFACPAYQTIF